MPPTLPENKILLNVPLVGQKTRSDGKPLRQPNAKGKLEQHGFMACWFAAACMVSYYYKPGPRLGLPKVWRADAGLSLQAISALAQVEGLVPVQIPKGGFNAQRIYELLKQRGPIWAAGLFLDQDATAGHVVVVTGIQDTVVHYNDPWEPEAKTRDAAWFRTNLLDIHGAVLVKDQARS